MTEKTYDAGMDHDKQAAEASGEVPTLPAASGEGEVKGWRERGEADPHGTRYDTEKPTRADLTDDMVAFKLGVLCRSDMDHQAVLQLGMDRIRWLSRKLAALTAERDASVKAYYDVADAVCRESTGPEDLCRQAREIRRQRDEAIASLQKEAARATAAEGERDRLRGEAAWQPIADAPMDPNCAIRVIGAVGGQRSHVIGDIYFGCGELRLNRLSDEQYRKERMDPAWRYSQGGNKVPEHLQPTHFKNLPDAPALTTPSVGGRRVTNAVRHGRFEDVNEHRDDQRDTATEEMQRVVSPEQPPKDEVDGDGDDRRAGVRAGARRTVAKHDCRWTPDRQDSRCATEGEATADQDSRAGCTAEDSLTPSSRHERREDL